MIERLRRLSEVGQAMVAAGAGGLAGGATMEIVQVASGVREFADRVTVDALGAVGGVAIGPTILLGINRVIEARRQNSQNL